MIGSFRAWLASRPLFYVMHALRNDGVLHAIRQLEASQWYKAEELIDLQREKLARLLEHAACHVPYYRELFKRLGVTHHDLMNYDVFRRLPFLTKAAIRGSGDALISERASKNDLLPNGTSGSTGEPFAFYNDRRATAWQKAVVWRNQEWVGVYYSDREARLWGAMLDISKAGMFREKVHGWLHQKLMLSSYDLTDEAMARYVMQLRKFRPRLLISYPGPLATFCQYLNSRNICGIPGLRAVITSAEQLHAWQRELIERVLKVPVFDRYGCREVGNIAHECERHEGYHINAERFIVEILDDDGNPVRPGEIGSIYITDLDNHAYPFIRYSMGDRAVHSDHACSCGRGLPLIERLEGRVMEVVKCPNGNRLGGTFWTIVLRKRIPGLQRYQIEQTTRNDVVIRLVMSPDASPVDEDRVLSMLSEKCGPDMNIHLEYVDRIPLARSGKERLVIAPQFD